MVEVFKTNVLKRKKSEKIIAKFSKKYPALKVNFDLEDCDKILRIEGEDFCPLKVRKILIKMGYECEILGE